MKGKGLAYQARESVAELQILENANKGDPETERVIDGIRNLANRLREERHIYLKFYGD